MSVALGTSTPTSMTVVETRTSTPSDLFSYLEAILRVYNLGSYNFV